MGNQLSAGEDPTLTRKFSPGSKLLSRNKRTAFPTTPAPSIDEYRSARSHSLEPAGVEFDTIRAIEHSQSARYRRSKRFGIRQCTAATLRPESPAPRRPSRVGLGSTESVGRPLPPACPTKMTPAQKLVVQKAWMRSSPREYLDAARCTLLQLLHTDKNLFEMWKLPKLPDTELLALPLLTRLAANFAMVIDFVMTSLADVQKASTALQSLGAHHIEYPYIDDSLWEEFEEALTTNPPETLAGQDGGLQIWQLMVQYIIAQMHYGYLRASEEQKAAR